MRLGAFELDEPVPELKEPHVFAMLQPWIDVGSVGTLTLSWLEKCFQAADLARLARPGTFFDFTRYRPTIYYEGERRQMAVPNSYITSTKRKEGERDLLFAHLLEPHSHGEVFVESMARLLDRFDVRRYCLLGSMYDVVPHTRPLLVTGSATDQETQQKLEMMGIRHSNYQGPTSIVSMIAQQAQNMGMDTMSLIVHLPQYTQIDEDYTGVVRLLEVLAPLYDLVIDRSYIEKAEKQLEQVSRAVEKNPQLKSTIEQLERYYEERASAGEKTEKELPRLSPEVEQFLSEMERRFREG